MSGKKFLQHDISFTCDGLKLTGILHLPGSKQPPLVIGSHGLFSSGHSPKQIALAEECCRLGMAYFRFDHRGCGRSEGEFDQVTSLNARCRDLVAAAETIKNRADIGTRLGLFGSSMGGSVCLSAAGQLGADAMVTFAAPIRSDLSGARPGMAHSTILLDAAHSRFDISARLSTISHILIFHGEADDVVPVSHGREIYHLARRPKKIILQQHGDHPMSNPEHQNEFVAETSAWFRRWLKGD